MKGGSKIKPGIYKHYKGGLYKVLFIARHSETLEEMVVYEHVEKSADKYWGAATLHVQGIGASRWKESEEIYAH